MKTPQQRLNFTNNLLLAVGSLWAALTGMILAALSQGHHPVPQAHPLLVALQQMPLVVFIAAVLIVPGIVSLRHVHRRRLHASHAGSVETLSQD